MISIMLRLSLGVDWCDHNDRKFCTLDRSDTQLLKCNMDTYGCNMDDKTDFVRGKSCECPPDCDQTLYTQVFIDIQYQFFKL